MPASDTLLEQVYQDIVQSLGYKTTVGPTDKSKVSRRYAGQLTQLPSSRLGRAAWRVAAALRPIAPPPPPPPPPFKKVAPLVAYAVDNSNGRFCLFNVNGDTRPGVSRQEDGSYRDEVGHYDRDGLQLGAERSETAKPGLTSAKEIDGRDICSLPMVGDPTKNTGSWAI